MTKVIQLSDAIAEKKIRQIKPTDERKTEREQILKEERPVRRSSSADLSEAVKKLEYKLAECEESFYNFTKSTVEKGDALVFTAFFISHMRNFVDALSIDETGEEVIVCMDYLKDLSERVAKSYLSDLLGM